MKILFTPKGRRRELAVSRWWRENGSQPDLFDREMLAALERLKKSPSSGTLYATLDGSDVRRVLLKRSIEAVRLLPRRRGRGRGRDPLGVGHQARQAAALSLL